MIDLFNCTYVQKQQCSLYYNFTVYFKAYSVIFHIPTGTLVNALPTRSSVICRTDYLLMAP